MNKITKFYESRKNIILASIGILTILVTGIVIYEIANNQSINRINETLPVDSNSILSENIIVGNDAGVIKSISVKDGKEVNSIKIGAENASKFMYSRAKDFKTLYIYEVEQNKFHEVSLNNGQVVSKELIELKDEKIEVSDFKIEGDMLLTLSNDKKTINQISMKNNSIKAIQLQDGIEDWVNIDNYVVYSNGTKIYSLNMIDGIIKQIEIGDTTTGLTLSNGDVIEFNKFGSGNNTSIMLKLNPSDLYIKGMTKFDTANVSGLISDSDDKEVYIGEVISVQNKATQLISDVDVDTMIKSTTSFNSQRESTTFKYDKTNSVSSNGYIYSLVDNTIEITNVKIQQVVRKVNIDGAVFMPVVK